MMSTITQPFLNLWFGNFYEPAYSDKIFIEGAMKHIHELGYQHIQLDSKAWQDFEDRYQGKLASPYVAMQEYMMEEAGKNDLGFNFLSLYLNGDNLFPNIRFSPPIYGESVTNRDGSDGKWYKYWSDKAQESMIHHIEGLLRQYDGDGHSMIQVDDIAMKPMCTMWDPIVAPSFDEDGINHYKNWLLRKYASLKTINEAYALDIQRMADLNPESYWFKLAYPDSLAYTYEELVSIKKIDQVKVTMWIDNMQYLSETLVDYFRDMYSKIKAVDPKLYIVPDLAQWSYFLNIDGRKLTGVGFADLWDTAMRGVDFFKVAPYVDCASVVTVPVTPSGDPEAYVVSAQHAMMRSMNHGRDYIGGLYLGRYLYQDLYRTLTPEEVIGSMGAQGAKGYLAYGYCGLDDGGMLYRMPDYFESNLTKANQWMRQVVLKTGERLSSEVAILYPSAMSLNMPLCVETAEERRLDFLGYFKALSDIGYMPDILSEERIIQGNLNQYKVLIMPNNATYQEHSQSQMVRLIKQWVLDGGHLLHGPEDVMAMEIAPYVAQSTSLIAASIGQEDILLASPVRCAYQIASDEEESLAEYHENAGAFLVKNILGHGSIHRIGTMLGYEYMSKVMPHVPIKYKNQALYPIIKMAQPLLATLLEDMPVLKLSIYGEDVEVGRFMNGWVVVNHRSYPFTLEAMGIEVGARSSIFIEDRFEN